jgi:hypothetical protein
MSPPRIHLKQLIALLLATVGAAACSAQSGDTTPADEEALQSRSCSNIPLTATKATSKAQIDAFIQKLWDANFTGAHTDRYDGDYGFVYDMRLPLDTTNASREEAVIKALEQYGPDLFHPGELELQTRTGESPGSVTLIFQRARIGSEATLFYRPAVVATLNKFGAVWQLFSVHLIPSMLLATETEAKALRRCTPNQAPPRNGTLAKKFTGSIMNGCAREDGRYKYTPDAQDTIEILTDPIWQTNEESGPSPFPTKWLVTREATLTVNPANYWPDVAKADCSCGNKVGFTLVIDARTGNVVSYEPAINCVRC